MITSIQAWTPDTDPTYHTVAAALATAGVDLDRLTMTPDGTFTLTVDGGRIAFGVDSDETEGDWWTAIAYVDGTETTIYEGSTLTGLVTELAGR